jgi:hypothetical protein
MSARRGTWELSSNAIAVAIRQMHRLGGRASGPAIWRASKTAVRIEWKGCSHELAVIQAAGALAFRVPARAMVALASSRAARGSFTIAIDRETVRLDGLRLPLVEVDADLPTDILAVDAGPLEALQAAERYSEAVLANAGLSEATDDAHRRLRATAQAMAKAAAWTGVDAETIHTWLARQIANRSSAFRPSSIDNRPSRQLPLFE